MTKLNQIIAIVPGVKTKGERDLTDIYHRSQKAELLTGIARTYQPKDEDPNAQQFPPESKRVQFDVERSLDEIRVALSRLFDVQATLDWTNCQAKGDVVVDGQVLLEQVPATYLLFLEKSLTHLRTVVGKFPILDPADKWVRDPAVEAWATEEPVQTLRTTKVPKGLVLYPATTEHPAQVQAYQEDVVVGTWTTRKFSGALQANRRRELVERIDTLVMAVKFAREQANSTDANDRKVAKLVFDYLFA